MGDFTEDRRAAMGRARLALMTNSRLAAAKVPPKLKKALEVVRAGIQLGIVQPEDLEGDVVQLDDYWWADQS